MLIKTSQIIIFPTRLFLFRVSGARCPSQQLRAQSGTHLGRNALPLQGHSHTHLTLFLGQPRLANSRHTRRVGTWEGTGVPEKTTQTWGERVHSAHSGPGTDVFFLIDALMTLNKTTFVISGSAVLELPRSNQTFDHSSPRTNRLLEKPEYF